jgi:hypothetical protein
LEDRVAAKQNAPGPAYLDEHHQRIAEFASDYFDDDDERDAFVNTLMERRGYTQTTGWALPQAPDPDPASGGGGVPVPPPGPKRPAYFKR